MKKLQKTILAACVSGLLIPRVSLADDRTTSFNHEIKVVPAPGAVKIDGKTDDWDLSAGIWSYNDPTIVERYSVWTHMGERSWPHPGKMAKADTPRNKATYVVANNPGHATVMDVVEIMKNAEVGVKTGMVSDVPTEARLYPNRWETIEVAK